MDEGVIEVSMLGITLFIILVIHGETIEGVDGIEIVNGIKKELWVASQRI
jgi:hypothetical protein